MSKKNILFVLIFCMCVIKTPAQTFTILHDKAFGGTNGEERAKMIYAGNYEIIIGGSSSSGISGNKTVANCGLPDGWVLKLDTTLNIIWQHTYGGSLDESSFNLNAGSTLSNILFAATSKSDTSCQKAENCRGSDDFWVGAIDGNGNLLWGKTWGGSSSEMSPTIIQLTSGDYVVGNASISPISGDKTVVNYDPGNRDYWLIKFDSLGNKKWDKVFGGLGDEYGPNSNWINTALTATTNDHLFLIGSSRSSQSGNVSGVSYGYTDYWIVKIDSAGTVIWNKLLGGSSPEWVYDMLVTTDGGCLIAGATQSLPSGLITDFKRGVEDYWIVKLDAAGNLQWQKRYGGFTGASRAVPQAIHKYVNGSYLIAGTVVGAVGNEVSEGGATSDYWVLCIDSVGNKLWDKRFGGPREDYLYDMKLLPDTSIVLFGIADTGISATKTDYGYGGGDFWVVRFKENFIGTGINAPTNQNNLMAVYPNPAQEMLSVQSTKYKVQRVEVYNLLGEKVLEQTVKNQNRFAFNVEALNKGIYFLKALTEKGNSVVKFIKE